VSRLYSGRNANGGRASARCAPSRTMASAGAHLVALNGLGAAAAPLLVAVAFLAVGNQGYYWVLSGVHAMTGLAVVAVAWAARRSRQHRAAWTGVVS